MSFTAIFCDATWTSSRQIAEEAGSDGRKAKPQGESKQPNNCGIRQLPYELPENHPALDMMKFKVA